MGKSYDHRDCSKRPSSGKAGTSTAVSCAQHAEYEMVNVRKQGCGHSGYTKPSYGNVYGNVASNSVEIGGEHAEGGMVHVCQQRWVHQAADTR